MSTKLGLTARLYYNSGTYAAPVWVDTSSLIHGDVTLNLDKGDADVSTRISNYKKHKGTMKDVGLSFSLLCRDAANAVYLAFLDSWANGTLMDMLVLTGPRDVAGNDGPRMFMEVFKFDRAEPLENAIAYSVEMKTALDDDDTEPVWVTTPV